MEREGKLMKYMVHKDMRDVCFMVLETKPTEIMGLWVNISSKDPQHHFPIERETLKKTQFKDLNDWASFSSTEEARAHVRGKS